jgi:hypothetical protein
MGSWQVGHFLLHAEVQPSGLAAWRRLPEKGSSESPQVSISQIIPCYEL